MQNLLTRWRKRLADQEKVTAHGEAYHRALRHCIEDLELQLERPSVDQRREDFSAGYHAALDYETETTQLCWERYLETLNRSSTDAL